jgi:hypothetical protein
MKNVIIKWSLALCLLFFPLVSFGGTTLFQENFDDANFSSRGWYDGATGSVDTSNFAPGSTASFKCHFLLGGTGCNPADVGNPFRHKFTPTNSVYLSYWVLHSSSWIGSGLNYHPHIFYFLTNLDGDYAGLADSYLDAYVEENQGYPQLNLQDGQNINTANIGVNLIGATENRAVAGCNGTQSGLNLASNSIPASCYLSNGAGSAYWNGMDWQGPTAYFFSSAKTSWHHVEAYFQLNTIVNGIGQPNGVLQYWYDGQLVINQNNVIMRTGANPTMQFDQLVLAPYIGVGSPADQTIWFDNLLVATSRPTSTMAAPSPPTNLIVH